MDSLSSVDWHDFFVFRNLDYRATFYRLLCSASWSPLGPSSSFKVPKDCCTWSFTGNIPRSVWYLHHCATCPRNMESQSRVSKEIGASGSFHDRIHVCSSTCWWLLSMTYWPKPAGSLPVAWLCISEFWRGNKKTLLGMLTNHTCACKRYQSSYKYYQVERKLTWISFVETYVAIIVSCAPASFSFWRNHIATTKLFSNIWSLLVSSRSTDSATKKSERGPPGVKCPSSRPPRRLPQNEYFELQGPEQRHRNRTSTEIQHLGKYLTTDTGTTVSLMTVWTLPITKACSVS